MDMPFNRLACVSRTACVSAAVLLGACSSTPVMPPVATTEPARPVAPAVPTPTDRPAAETAPVVKPVLPPYLDPANPLSKQRSVYFDFDQSSIKPEGRQVLEMHGKYLAAHSNVTIRVEGNTDEQGGSEYNLALGQKRAEAVVNTLKVLGVSDAQMEAVSFGKEKPVALGHDEESHAENRRADLDYMAK
jgi:peptidoglycan-associated lipoprotein